MPGRFSSSQVCNSGRSSSRTISSSGRPPTSGGSRRARGTAARRPNAVAAASAATSETSRSSFAPAGGVADGDGPGSAARSASELLRPMPGDRSSGSLRPALPRGCRRGRASFQRTRGARLRLRCAGRVRDRLQALHAAVLVQSIGQIENIVRRASAASSGSAAVSQRPIGGNAASGGAARPLVFGDDAPYCREDLVHREILRRLGIRHRSHP